MRLISGAGVALHLKPPPQQRRGPALTPPRPAARPLLTPGLRLPGRILPAFGEADLAQIDVGRGAQHPVAHLPAVQVRLLASTSSGSSRPRCTACCTIHTISAGLAARRPNAPPKAASTWSARPRYSFTAFRDTGAGATPNAPRSSDPTADAAAVKSNRP
ncbi:hypothetical protein LUR56_05570 [Streptomyces sp. MT29]|nr:hypothetical protein [Streptomyces sp. MT29]